ncbi:MAG TPA: ferredoxin reductase [Polyangiaceae bacterium]|nr:ferredoxin reductase [Polyangiaceae bacterium]
MERILEPRFRTLFRVLESPLVTRWLGEPTFDFYAGLVSPMLTARRIVARVEAIHEDTPSVKSFALRPNGHFRGFRAGQHVNVTVEIDGVRHTRAYSPSNAPGARDGVVLTVKRHEGGRVSQWLHDHLQVGDVVELGQAFGDFTAPREPGKLLLVAGGSGVTPIASLLRDVCRRLPDPDVVVLLYGRTYADLIFAREFDALAREHAKVQVHRSVTGEPAASRDLSGRFSTAHLDAVAPDAAERRAFVCGPRALIDDVRALWAERALPSPLRTETFAPPEAAPDADLAPTLRVTAARTARSFAANTATPLLVQAERAGLSPASGCRQGICFSCTCRKKTGLVRDLSTGVVSSEPDEDVRLCVTVPLSDVALDL